MRIKTVELSDKDRTPLWEVAPLSQPWTVYIDVTNLCNFKCVYCPTGNPEMISQTMRYNGHMTLGVFKKVVTDLRELDQLRIVNLYKDGDPLVNPNFCNMVHILRSALLERVRIYSKTNGELIPHTPNLAAAPLDMLGLSVPHVTDDGIRSIVGKPVSYKRYKDGVKRLYEDSRRQFTLNAKMARYKMTEAHIEKFYRDFEPITDTVAIEGLHGWGANDLGDMLLGVEVEPHDGSPVVPHIACPLPFMMMSVNSDGTTAVCCSEWGHFHDLGDVKLNTLKEIFNNEKSKAFRLMHLEGRRYENMACKDCQYRDTLQDNIDGHLKEMIERMK
jgi:radical SAM protein with 4Fe4S-binding SPASM domain